MNFDTKSEETREIKKMREHFKIPAKAKLVTRSGDDGGGTEFFLFEHEQRYCILCHEEGCSADDWQYLVHPESDGYHDVWDMLNAEFPRPMWFTGSGQLLLGIYGADPEYDNEWGGTYTDFAENIRRILT
jgi:hypothetical protein